MNYPASQATSRREFLKTTGKAATAISALAGIALPAVHAQGSDQIKIALIGCGGRGGGAAKNALSGGSFFAPPPALTISFSRFIEAMSAGSNEAM